MDDHLTFLNEGKLTLQEAATIGVGALVSSVVISSCTIWADLLDCISRPHCWPWIEVP